MKKREKGRPGRTWDRTLYSVSLGKKTKKEGGTKEAGSKHRRRVGKR